MKKMSEEKITKCIIRLKTAHPIDKTLYLAIKSTCNYDLSLKYVL